MRIFSRFWAAVKLFFSFFGVSFQISYGLWKLLRLPKPRVTIFGGSRIKFDDPYALMAMQLAQRLVEHKISVITGGGPGIMLAANCGAVANHNGTNNGLRSLGITVKGFEEEEEVNRCVQELITMDYFFSRKWLLTNYSDAYVFFPGGLGTLDELAEISTLIQVKKISPAPIVLIGTEYWAPFITWMRKALERGLLKEQDKDLFMVTDDIGQAFSVLKDRCETLMAPRDK